MQLGSSTVDCDCRWHIVVDGEAQDGASRREIAEYLRDLYYPGTAVVEVQKNG